MELASSKKHAFCARGRNDQIVFLSRKSTDKDALELRFQLEKWFQFHIGKAPHIGTDTAYSEPVYSESQVPYREKEALGSTWFE